MWRLLDLSGRGAARANDAQGKHTKGHISPSILVYEKSSNSLWRRVFRTRYSIRLDPAQSFRSHNMHSGYDHVADLRNIHRFPCTTLDVAGSWAGMFEEHRNRRLLASHYLFFSPSLLRTVLSTSPSLSHSHPHPPGHPVVLLRESEPSLRMWSLSASR